MSFFRSYETSGIASWEYYLDVQVDKGMLSDEFRAKMDMEQAMVILSGARNVGNGAERDKKFAEAKYFWNDFRRRPKFNLKIQANNELGNLLYQRANWWNLKEQGRKCPAKPICCSNAGAFNESQRHLCVRS